MTFDQKNTLSSVFERFTSPGAADADNRITFSELKVDGSEWTRHAERREEGVFVVMSLLRESMSKGAMLTQLIYVPRTVWFQSGAKFAAYKEKIEAFEILQQELLHLHDDFGDPDKLEAVSNLWWLFVCCCLLSPFLSSIALCDKLLSSTTAPLTLALFFLSTPHRVSCSFEQCRRKYRIDFPSGWTTSTRSRYP